MKNKSVFFFALIILSLFFANAQQIKCIGGDVSQLQDNCQIIIEAPLQIWNFGDASFLESKLKSIETIENGMEIVNTDFHVFNFLPNLISIRNPSGPAILFKGNSNLQRIDLPKLQSLIGTSPQIVFHKDNFIKSAYENQHEKSLSDFQNLRRAVGIANLCDNSFFSVTDFEVETSWIDHFGVSIGLSALIFLLLIFDVAWICWMKRIRLEKPNNPRKKTQKKVPKTKKKKTKGSPKRTKGISKSKNVSVSPMKSSMTPAVSPALSPAASKKK